MERPPDSAGEQQPVDSAGDPGARLVLDDESVDESLTGGLEVALVRRVGQTGLRAGVGHEPVRLERRECHRQHAFAPEQPSHQPCSVSGRSPARAVLQADVPGPIPRPIRRVGDEGEAMLDADLESVSGFDSRHAEDPISREIPPRVAL